MKIQYLLCSDYEYESVNNNLTGYTYNWNNIYFTVRYFINGVYIMHSENNVETFLKLTKPQCRRLDIPYEDNLVVFDKETVETVLTFYNKPDEKKNFPEFNSFSDFVKYCHKNYNMANDFPFIIRVETNDHDKNNYTELIIKNSSNKSYKGICINKDNIKLRAKKQLIKAKTPYDRNKYIYYDDIKIQSLQQMLTSWVEDEYTIEFLKIRSRETKKLFYLDPYYNKYRLKEKTFIGSTFMYDGARMCVKAEDNTFFICFVENSSPFMFTMCDNYEKYGLPRNHYVYIPKSSLDLSSIEKVENYHNHNNQFNVYDNFNNFVHYCYDNFIVDIDFPIIMRIGSNSKLHDMMKYQSYYFKVTMTNPADNSKDHKVLRDNYIRMVSQRVEKDFENPQNFNGRTPNTFIYDDHSLSIIRTTKLQYLIDSDQFVSQIYTWYNQKENLIKGYDRNYIYSDLTIVHKDFADGGGYKMDYSLLPSM